MTIIIGGCAAFDERGEPCDPSHGHWPDDVIDAPRASSLPAFFGLDVLEPLQQVGGTCYAFALCQWLRMLAVRDGIVMDKPSGAWFVSYSHLVDVGGIVSAALARAPWGSYTPSTLVAAQQYGISFEHDYPSTPENCERFAPWPVRVKADDRRLRLEGLVHCASNEEIARTLVELRSPVMVSLPTYTEVEHNDGSTILTGAGNYLGGHVWLVVGYRTGDDGKRVWLVQTTWGRCGLKGFGLYEMSDDYMAKAVHRFGCTKLVLVSGA